MVPISVILLLGAPGGAVRKVGKVDPTPLIDSFSAGPSADRWAPELMVKGAASVMPALQAMLPSIDPSWPVDWRKHHCILSMAAFVKSRRSQRQASGRSTNDGSVGSHRVKSKGSRSLPQVFHSHSAGKTAGMVYSQIVDELGGRDAPLRMLEIGIGTNKTSAPSTMATWKGSNVNYLTGNFKKGKMGGAPEVRPYVPGASLRAWRDYLTNARVFGADVDPDILFEEERIRTHVVDQLAPATFNALHHDFGGAPYDLLIDDGLHAFAPNLNSLEFALRAVKRGGWIVVEDISVSNMRELRVVDWMLTRRGDVDTCFVEQMGNNPIERPVAFLYVIHRRP